MALKKGENEMEKFETINGGVCAAKGFKALVLVFFVLAWYNMQEYVLTLLCRRVKS